MTIKLNSLKRHDYEPPRIELITIETPCVLCSSAPSMMNSGTGSNESMTIQEIEI